MNWQKVKISTLKESKENPRTISDEKLEKLVQSIKEFPQMLEIRPIVVSNNQVLGGNMRLRAAKLAGLKEIPVIEASNLTEQQKKEFIIKDNVGFGQWDWEMLHENWDTELLDQWGLEVWEHPEEADYSVLNDEEEAKADALGEGVKKSILIEFESGDYEIAFELIKFFREKNSYVGGMLIDHLQNEKHKI